MDIILRSFNILQLPEAYINDSLSPGFVCLSNSKKNTILDYPDRF